MNAHPLPPTSDAAAGTSRNVDAGELDKFASLAHQWWDPEKECFVTFLLDRATEDFSDRLAAVKREFSAVPSGT